MKSDWSDSDDGKDNQARKKPIRHDITSDWETEREDQETIIEASLRRPNTMPKVLTCRKGKFPVANWTSIAKGKEIIHRLTDMTYLTPFFQEETQMLKEIQ